MELEETNVILSDIELDILFIVMNMLYNHLIDLVDSLLFNTLSFSFIQDIILELHIYRAM